MISPIFKRFSAPSIGFPMFILPLLATNSSRDWSVLSVWSLLFGLQVGFHCNAAGATLAELFGDLRVLGPHFT